MEHLKPGLSGDLEFEVAETHTAAHWGSGLVPVFSTPALVGLMEGAAVAALAEHLPAEHTSVGGRIDVRHLAPTPIGMRVRAHAELMAVEGRKLIFRVEAWDAREKIGEATHERFVIETAPFVAQAEGKADLR
jgi:predicted thioesterase